MSLRTFLFAFDAFSVELSAGFTGTIFLFVIGRVFGIDVLTNTALAGVRTIVLELMSAVLREELFVPMFLGPGFLCLDRELASLIIARSVVLAFAQADVHALLTVPLGCFPVVANRDSLVVVRP